jgi:transcriptional regulator with PAS, ATPase and Fis domain
LAAVAFFAASVTIVAKPMVSEIVGRDAEIASLRTFIDEAEAGQVAPLLEGEVGIGKSMLWEAAVA